MSVDTCNYCHKGVAEFHGHEFNNKAALCFSIYRCTVCGAIYKHPMKINGPNAFDVEHPKAKWGMLPTWDWMRRKGLTEGR
jgi:hypothetical protein